MDDPKAKLILDQYESLAQIRDIQLGVWQELSRICFPRSTQLFGATPETTTTDRQRVAQNWDGTAMRACNTLATGQAARITPMGARWFVLRPPANLQGNTSAERWYARCTEILIAALGGSNFYNRAFECYQSRGAFGISALEIRAGTNSRGFHFSSLPIGTYAVAENQFDEVDTLFRCYMRSPAQMAQAYGEVNLPPLVRKAYDDVQTRNKQSEKVIHGVFPRRMRDPRKIDPQNKPVESIHIHADSQTVLLESGFDSNPFAVSRWQTNPLSPYGWAPADYALPEACQLNFLEQMQDVLAEIAAYPRVLYPAGMKDDLDFAAMGLTSFDPAAGEYGIPREWLTGGRYDIAKDRAEDKKRAIEDSFFVPLFTAISRLGPDPTATHVSAIVSESRELFHPIYSAMVREFHTPTLRRCFSLGLEQGMFPDPPRSVIQADELGAFIADPDVEYVTAMALALEQSSVQGFQDVIATVSPLAAADPSWLEPLDPAATLEHLLRVKGLPVAILRTDEQMAAIAQQKAAMAQAQVAKEAAQAVGAVGGVDEAQRMLSQ